MDPNELAGLIAVRLYDGRTHWESTEVLTTSRNLALLVSSLLESGRARTRHHDAGDGRFVLARWGWGPNDYVALENRESFLRDCADERDIADWIDSRAEFVSISVDQRWAGRDEELAELARHLVGLMSAARDRCGLKRGGYLVQLGERFHGDIETLALYDRHLALERRLRHAT